MIVTLGNVHNAILVSDRRLVMPDGSRNDESNKAFLLITDDARVAIGFSGLAGIPSDDFWTRFWLPKSLAKLAVTDHSLGGILERLKACAERDISSFRVTAENRKLSIVGVGYHYVKSFPRLVAFRLSNFESPDMQPKVADRAGREFALWTWVADEGATDARLRHISGWNTAPDQIEEPWDELYEWLRVAKPPRAVVSRAVRMIRLMADPKVTRGYVGRECMSIIVPNEPSASSISEYHSSTTKVSTYMPGLIEARGGDRGVYAVTDVEMGIADVSGSKLISAVPQVPRNRPCSCGNGRKYKYCHGQKGATIHLGSV